jgi:hypothetical protein
MTLVAGPPVEEDAFTAFFDRSMAGDRYEDRLPSVRMSRHDWPEPEDFPELSPGHFGSEAFEDRNDAIALIEEEGGEQYSDVYRWDDGYWYIYYFDET